MAPAAASEVRNARRLENIWALPFKGLDHDNEKRLPVASSWDLLRFLTGDSRSVFPREGLHTEISPLRYASVEMTKGRAVLPRESSC
jgi:hypothetical protein